jgi:hypothetical protein
MRLNILSDTLHILRPFSIQKHENAPCSIEKCLSYVYHLPCTTEISQVMLRDFSRQTDPFSRIFGEVCQLAFHKLHMKIFHGFVKNNYFFYLFGRVSNCVSYLV